MPNAANIIVPAGSAVSVAPEGTALPTDLSALPAAWDEIGYVGEDGATITTSREEEAINAWQSDLPVRTLVTAEPKTISMELLEWNPDTVRLAFRGGAITVAAGVAKYTPPAAGARDVRAMVIDAVDGSSDLRFAFTAVQVQGDVESQLVRSAAMSLPLEFAVQAGTPPWIFLTDHPTWAAFTLAMESLSAHELREKADALGLELPKRATKEELAAAIAESEANNPVNA